MRFKSITLQGFKSFVEKTIVDFPDGITCVVGPNGSGKSNIMDAIRWVFGEQSPKELRGNDMEDVIFGGSIKRKPSGFAEVSLTVSNLPESVTAKWGTLSEVTIARKLYRTGEREYKINNRKCRLKDIREIFYDTGMGARSISIIEQGKVEKIIQATPEELRQFLEETAGVVRFKERKKEAERRLEQTKDNLGRVYDIISEVRSNIETLTKQAEVVKEYRTLASKVQDIEKNIILHRYIKQLDESDRLREEINREKIGITDVITNFEKLVTEETQREKALNNLRGAFKETNERMLSLGDIIADISGDLRQLESEISGAEKTTENLNNEINELEERQQSLHSSKRDIANKKDETEKNRDKLTEAIEEIEDKIDECSRMRDDLKYEIDEIDDEYINLTQKLTSLNNNLFQKETTLNRLQADMKRFTLEKDDLEAEISNATKKVEDVQQEYQSAKDSFQNISNELKHLKTKLNDIKAVETEAKAELENFRNEKNLLENKTQILKAQLDNIAVGESGEFLKRFNAKLLIDTLDKDLEAPLHIADILVFPSEQKHLVLATVKEMSGSLRFVFSEDIPNIIKDLENFEKVSENIFKSNSIYKKIGDDAREVMIIKLKSELKTALNSLATVSTEFQSSEEKYQTIADELLKLSEEFNEKETKKTSFEAIIKSSSRMLDEAVAVKEKLSRRGEIIEKETEFVERELLKIDNEINIIRKEREDVAKDQAEKEEEKQLLDERLEDINNLLEDEKDELSSLKIEERGFIEQAHSLSRELEQTNKNIDEAIVKISSTKERLNKLLNVDIISFQEQYQIKKDEYLQLMKEQQELRTNALSTDKEVAEQEKELLDLKKEIEKANKEVEKLRSTVTDSEIKHERVLAEIQNLSESFAEKFKTSIALEEPDLSDFQPNKAKAELELSLKLIDSLGPLNMAAEQELDEISKRDEFLTQQRADLEDAISSIHELISEIDDSTAALFKSTFEGVKENFKKVFDILFGDGNAELRLSEPDNFLSSGVEIFVQPPGKKLVNMNLLSGGEKAMSACTLLFALFLYKPTPFCFLDEIDAPLDEANIDKFMNVVKTLSGDTQFVIITHSQKTMSEADNLYGVTMQEPGVSKMLSVRLSDLNL